MRLALSAAARDRLRRVCLELTPNESPAAPHVRLHDPERAKRRAAVLVPLVAVGDEPHFLFTVRTESVGSHKGQVSFPGGHIDPGETPEAAALREAEEELALGRASVEVLGRFHDCIAITGTRVTPVLGLVDGAALAGLRAAPDEVSEFFTLSVEQLLDPALREWQDLGIRGARMPAFNGGPQQVWGLTAYILQGVLDEVVCPALAPSRL